MKSLDPEDYSAFRKAAHELLDRCIDYLQESRGRPWRPVPPSMPDLINAPLPIDGAGEAELARQLSDSILLSATGNGHPRFFGWVHGTGLPACLLSEMVSAAMNSNCGGRNHGAIYIERVVIEWCRKLFGFPSTSSGLITTGTSQATIIALAVARYKACGSGVRQQGVFGHKNLVAYCSEDAHSANTKAMELLGLGSSALQRIKTCPNGSIDTRALRDAIENDKALGKDPYLIIGTAGSVDSGAFDDLSELARLAALKNIWLHVDGAFGAWILLADHPWRELANGLHLADSLAFDFHKWPYVQYDCGAVLIRDRQLHLATFAERPYYLESHAEGLAAGDPWFCDFGPELSRGFRALKVWSAFRAYGTSRFSKKISDNCRLVKHMGSLIESIKDIELSRPIVTNVCCFRFVANELSLDDQDQLNAAIAEELQLAGIAVLSTTVVEGRRVLRAAITNHRTNAEDVEITIRAVLEFGTRLRVRFNVC